MRWPSSLLKGGLAILDRPLDDVDQRVPGRRRLQARDRFPAQGVREVLLRRGIERAAGLQAAMSAPDDAAREAAAKKFLSGLRIAPPPITADVTAADLIDQTFLAYNGGRLREAARLLAEKMLAPEVTVGVTLTGALTPAGLGRSCLIPLIEHGFIDWMVS